MRDDRHMKAEEAALSGGKGKIYRFVIITLDAHAAGPASRIAPRLSRDFPGIEVSVHSAAEWAEDPAALARAKAAVADANFVVANLLFIEEHITAILPDLQRVRDRLDAFVGVIADPQIVKLTRMGDLDMSKPASGAMAFLKKMRGSKEPSASSGEKQMALLRRLPKILRFIPGKAQDMRAWFLAMQYWLGGSDDNIEQMIRFLLGRYAARDGWKGAAAKAPIDYPDLGLYHPRLPQRITTRLSDLPRPDKAKGTVGLLLLRSYILASDRAHYDAVIAAFEAQGLAVIPAFAGGLDARPAVDAYFRDARGTTIDALVSLSGFSMVGGPAYNDSPAAVAALTALDVPYIAAHPLEFQTLGQWAASGGGLGPVETTMLVALPEIDGASNPTVFAGRHGTEGCTGCGHRCKSDTDCKAMAPCHERISSLAEKTARMVRLRRTRNADKKVGVVLFGFPPNAGAAGTAAYLGVFESLHNTLTEMAKDGYTVTVPETVDDLRTAVLKGNAERYGQPANVHTTVSAADMVRNTPPLKAVEAVWGPRSHPVRRARCLHSGRAVRQRLCRSAADLRLRGRPDAPSVRAGLCAHPCLRAVLSLASQHLQRRCPFAFRDARRAGVHAGQADRDGRARLARSADWRVAEHLPLRREQPVRGLAGQAPVERDHHHPSDPASGAVRALQGSCRPEGHADPLARGGPGCSRAGRS